MSSKQLSQADIDKFLKRNKEICSYGSTVIRIVERKKNKEFRYEEGLTSEKILKILSNLSECDYRKTVEDVKFPGRWWHVFIPKYERADGSLIDLFVRVRHIEKFVEIVCLSLHKAEYEDKDGQVYFD